MILRRYNQRVICTFLHVLCWLFLFGGVSVYASPVVVKVAPAVVVPNASVKSTLTVITPTTKATIVSATPTPTPASAPSASAPASVGQVVWVSGVVKAISVNKVQRVLQRRGVIYAQDTIVTGEGASGEIVFSDNTITSLFPNSEIRVDKYQYTHGRAPSQDKYLVNVVKGGFRTITGAIAKSNPSNYQVSTPVATIGVRGTQWIVIVSPDQIYLKIERGSIQIQTPKGSAVLDKTSVNNLYAAIDVHNPVPKVMKVSPTAAFNSAPPLAPATSTLPQSNTNSSITPASPGGGTSGGGGGGTGTGSSGSSGSGSSTGGGSSVETGSSDTGTSSSTSDVGSASTSSSDSGAVSVSGGGDTSSSSQTFGATSGGSSGSSTSKTPSSGFCIQ